MSAVVASLPAPAVSAPHALIVAPPEGGAKLLFHPFFPLLHFMHLPHLFLHRPFGLGHHGLGHHGLGGFHHGLGGLGHHGLGGLGHHGFGGFPFRSLSLQQQAGGGPSSGGQDAAEPPPSPPLSGTPSKSTSSETGSWPPQSEHPNAVAEVESPQGPHQDADAAGHHSLYSAFITPNNKVVPASALFPPITGFFGQPSASQYADPFRIGASYAPVGAAAPAAPDAPAAPTASSAPAAPTEAAAPDAPAAPAAPVVTFVPVVPAGPTAPDIDVYTTINKLVYSAALPPPLPVRRPSPPAASPAPPPLCDCSKYRDEAPAMTRVELDHSLEQSPSSSATSQTAASPGPLSPPPTVPPVRRGDDSSPELPQRREKDDEELQDAEAPTLAASLTAEPSDSRVLILGDEQGASDAEATETTEIAEATETTEIPEQATETPEATETEATETEATETEATEDATNDPEVATTELPTTTLVTFEDDGLSFK